MLTLGSIKINVASVGQAAYQAALAYKKLRLQEFQRRLEQDEEEIRSIQIEISKLQQGYEEAKVYKV